MVPWLRFIVQARVNSNNFGRLLFTLHRLLLERESEYSLVAPRWWLGVDGELCRQVRRIKCIYSSPEAAAWPGMNNRFLGNYLLSPALRKGWNWNWNECHRGSGWVVVLQWNCRKDALLGLLQLNWMAAAQCSGHSFQRTSVAIRFVYILLIWSVLGLGHSHCQWMGILWNGKPNLLGKVNKRMAYSFGHIDHSWSLAN